MTEVDEEKVKAIIIEALEEFIGELNTEMVRSRAIQKIYYALEENGYPVVDDFSVDGSGRMNVKLSWTERHA